MKKNVLVVLCFIGILGLSVSCIDAGFVLSPWPDTPIPSVTLTTDAEYMTFGLGVYDDIIGISEKYYEEHFKHDPNVGVSPAPMHGITLSYPTNHSYLYTYANFDRGGHITNSTIPAGSFLYDGDQDVDHPANDMTRYIEKMDFTITLNNGGSSTTHTIELTADTYNAGPSEPVEVTFTRFKVDSRSYTQAELKAAHPEITALL